MSLLEDKPGGRRGYRDECGSWDCIRETGQVGEGLVDGVGRHPRLNHLEELPGGARQP